MQERNSKENRQKEDGVPNSMKATRESGQSQQCPNSPLISVKHSSIEQQLLEIKLQKIDTSNENVVINFINRIIHLMSETMGNFRPVHMTEIINVLLAKLTMVNYTSSLSASSKIEQIRKWKAYPLQPTASQLCSSITAYIIEQVDLPNFQQIIILLYFVLLWKIELEDRTLEAFNQSIKKYAGSRGHQHVGFVKEVVKLILQCIDEGIGVCPMGLVKLYCTCFGFFLQFYKDKSQLIEVESHLGNFGLVEALLTAEKSPAMDSNIQVFSQQKQTCFLYCCEVYALTGSKKLLRLIRLFVELGVTITMVRNCWNLLNTDHNLQLFTLESLGRMEEILSLLKQKSNESNKFCSMASRGAYISKMLEKKTSLFIFRFLIGHPREKKYREDQLQLLFRIQMEMGVIVVFAKLNTKQDQKQKPFLLFIRKQLRNLDENLKQRQEQQVPTLLQSNIETIVLEFKEDKKLWICSESKRLMEVNHAVLGRPKAIFVGVRKEEKNLQSLVRRVFVFIAVEDATYEQYLNEKDTKKSITSMQLTTSLKLPYKKSQSHNTSTRPIEKFDLFEHIQLNNTKQSLTEKLKLSTKSFMVQNVEVSRSREYKKMVAQFNGKEKLLAYVFNAFEAVEDAHVLEDFVEVVRKEWRMFQMTDEDIYALAFMHGESLFFKKPISLVEELLEYVQPPHRTEILKSSQRERARNEEQERIIIFRLQLLLKTMLESENSDSPILRKITLQNIENYLEWSLKAPRQQSIKSAKRLATFLNTIVLSYLNDYAIGIEKDIEKIVQQYQSARVDSNGVGDMKMVLGGFKLILNGIEGTARLMDFIQDCMKLIINKISSDALVIDCVVQNLQLILVTLSHVALSGRPYEPSRLLAVLQSVHQMLLSLSLELAQTKGISETDQTRICLLLSQLYIALPVLCCYSNALDEQKGKDDKEMEMRKSEFKEQEFYELYTASHLRSFRLKADGFVALMSDLYILGFSIGSYVMKEKKNGFLTYMGFVYRFLAMHKDSLTVEKSPSLALKDKICLLQLYSSCYKFALCHRPKEQSCYSLDRQTQIQVVSRLGELGLPLYHLERNGQRPLLQDIVMFYVYYCGSDQLLPNLLAGVDAEELEAVVGSIKKDIQSRKNMKAQDKLTALLYLISIVNSFPKLIRLDLDITPYQKQPRYGELQRLYSWYSIFSQIKNTFTVMRERSEQRDISNFKQPSQNIEATLKHLFTDIMDKLKDDPCFANVRFLMKTFISENSEKKGKEHEGTQKHFLPFFQVLYNQFEQINGSFTAQYVEKGLKERKKQKEKQKEKEPDLFALSLNTKQPITYLNTERGFLSQHQPFKQLQSLSSSLTLPSKEKQNISKRVAQRILTLNRQYFAEAYSKMVKDKNNTLVAYYKIIEKLSFEEKMYNIEGSSEKYQRYEYYILDDYLNSQNVKVMLKRDPVAILSNVITGEIPRLYEDKEVSKHTLYALKITKNLQDLNSHPFFQINMAGLETKQSESKQRGRATISAFLITKSKVYQGRVEIDEKMIRFTENTVIDKHAYIELYAHKSQHRTLQQISVSRRALAIDITEISYAQKKKYLQKFPSLQIFAAHLSYFFAFKEEEDRAKFIYHSSIPEKQAYEHVESVSECMKNWKKGWISNFQFLIAVNNLAGRSFNDVSQYYIFPWTVVNFRDPMDEEFFKRKDNFRDLNKPIGAINPKKLQMILNKYTSCVVEPQQFREKPYMYGSFYSNPGVVCNYLLRVNPFTIHHYELQGNSFDLYERLFTNMDDQFESIYNSALDNRELVPEFYCAPEFFRNRNRYNFAHTRPDINKVDLAFRMPKWVVTKSPEEFVLRMRRVLESNAVSAKLGAWIDFIFGHKSEYETADVHHNLYMHQLYASPKKVSKQQLEPSLSQIDNKAHMIKLFGQVPKNIFGNKPSQPKPVIHEIASSIYSEKVLLRDLLTPEQPKSKDRTKISEIVLDSHGSIMAISDRSRLVVMNTIEDVGKIRVNIDEPFQSLAILRLKKSLHFLLFAVTGLAKLYVYVIKKSQKASLLLNQTFQYKIESKIELFPGGKFSQVKTLGSHAIAVEQTSLRIINVSDEKSRRTVASVLSEQFHLEDKGYFPIHRLPIVRLQTYAGLEIIASLDASGLMNIFSLHPQPFIRSTFTLSPILRISQRVTKMQLHETGLLLLLTNLNQIAVYSIYGDLIQRVRVSDREIIDMVFWDDRCSSQLVITTRNGLIYQLDLFDLLEEGENCQAGLEVRLNERKSVEESKLDKKLAMFRFGRYWELYLVGSIERMTAIQCQEFSKNYQKKIFCDNTNNNNTYKNS